ncbi:MAG: NAD-dependent epimerase/dehydratase family protein [Bryobacterales bacterium]|nr:NAD-dependent epimerase/dehydratase family protein [Bryobacterales bacterium]
MRIGLTGVAGFIGSNLADALLARGHTVIGLDNLSMGSLRNIEHNLNRSGFEFHELDVRDLPAMREVFASADLIVHLAAYKIPRYGKAIDTLEINSIGGKNVLEVGRDGNRRVVLASTSDIYGKNPNVPFHELSDSLIGPTTVPRWAYAVSKLFDEHLALAYHSGYGVPVTILRFFGSYGPNQHLSWWGGPQSVFIEAMLRDQPLEIHGDGTQTRSFTYISDLVDGIVLATEYDKDPAIVLNLGNTKEITILDLAKLIYELCRTSRPLNLKMVPYASIGGNYEDVPRRIPDITRARTLLGFEPRIDIREGLGKTIEWQRRILGFSS